MYSRYSDVSFKNGMWRKIWIRDIERNLNDDKKVICRKMKKKKILRESNLWLHVSLLLTLSLTLISLPKNSTLKYINIIKRYTVVMHTIYLNNFKISCSPFKTPIIYDIFDPLLSTLSFHFQIYQLNKIFTYIFLLRNTLQPLILL
jgi:hypothetical protein